MKVIASVTTSLDGYLDDDTDTRLILSDDDHYRYIREIRAQCDAILVGAETVRKDAPRLNTRDKDLAQSRIDAGKPMDPVKVTLTRSGNLDPQTAFFSVGTNDKRIYADAAAHPNLDPKLYDLADIAILGQASVASVLEDLEADGFETVMIEGGAQILFEALATNLVDELHVGIAPFFVNANKAARLSGLGQFELVKTQKIGSVAAMVYKRR